MSIKKINCVDPKNGLRCHWHSGNANKCNRATYGNRIPMMATSYSNKPICELFTLKMAKKHVVQITKKI